jgi:hypothetical protein
MFAGLLVSAREMRDYWMDDDRLIGETAVIISKYDNHTGGFIVLDGEETAITTFVQR